MSKADAFDAAMSGCSTGGRTDNVQRFLAGLRGDKDYWPQYGIEEADKKLADRFEDALKNPKVSTCLLYTSPSPRDATLSRMPSSA